MKWTSKNKFKTKSTYLLHICKVQVFHTLKLEFGNFSKKRHTNPFSIFFPKKYSYSPIGIFGAKTGIVAPLPTPPLVISSKTHIITPLEISAKNVILTPLFLFFKITSFEAKLGPWLIVNQAVLTVLSPQKNCTASNVDEQLCLYLCPNRIGGAPSGTWRCVGPEEQSITTAWWWSGVWRKSRTYLQCVCLVIFNTHEDR